MFVGVQVPLRVQYAGIAQLVEHDLAKVGVASSSLVSRSFIKSLLIFYRGGLIFRLLNPVDLLQVVFLLLPSGCLRRVFRLLAPVFRLPT